jgi:peptidyl-prolyl cis-trans isomerase D
MRDELFLNNVQAVLLGKLVKTYALRASIDEMHDWLFRNPSDVAYSIMQYEGVEAVPSFLADSARFSPQAYQAWLAQDTVYDRPGMRMLEERMKANTIPQYQLQQIFFSQTHLTDLEAAFLIETRQDTASLRYYQVSADSFPAPAQAPTEEALKAHFEANPDSFWSADEGARLAYVRLPLVPSASDSALMRDFAGELHDRAQGGESFDDLAKSYSNDSASAALGGHLLPAAAGEWDPAFAAAAFSLAPGQISAPVLTSKGWHLIKLNSKTRVGGVEKADVSHILLTISAGTETSDSVLAVANALKDKAEDKGLAAAAEGAGLKVQHSPVFDKGKRAPLGRYVQGLTSFAFARAQRKEKVSDPIQNDDAVYVLEREATYPAGRDFDRSRDAVALDYARAQALKAARAEAERIRPEVTAAANPPATVGKAVLASAGPITADGFAPGFGFGGAALFQAMRQKTGEWGPVIPTSQGAVIAQVTQASPLAAAEKARIVQGSRRENDAYGAIGLYQKWMGSLPKSAHVKNYLDELYRE